MKNIRHILLEQFIVEGRLEDTIKKYSSTVSAEDIKLLSQRDPSGNNKYLDWMAKQIETFGTGYNNEIIEAIECFHTNVNRLSEKNAKAIYTNTTGISHDEIDKIIKSPKDINSYPTPETIMSMCRYFEEMKPKNTSRVKIYEDDRWLLVSPLTHKASCEYGSHSNWCVSTSNVSYYDRYTKDGILIFFLDKKGKNIKKPEANMYKFAAYIMFQQPSPNEWEWYTMEDTQVDAALMLNLVPKQLIDVSIKYLEEFVGELDKLNQIDEKELSEKSIYFSIDTDQGNEIYYNIFIDVHSWEPDEIDRASEFLKKYNGNQSVVHKFTEKKSDGFPYLYIVSKNGTRPKLNPYYISWIRSGYGSGNEIPLSFIKVKFAESIKDLTPDITPEQLERITKSYVDLFNNLGVTKNYKVNMADLVVGDTIIYRPRGRSWGQGTELKIMRVAEKSILLSNGKRIAKDLWRSVEKIGVIMKIVDDTKQTNESRWIRKRII